MGPTRPRLGLGIATARATSQDTSPALARAESTGGRGGDGTNNGNGGTGGAASLTNAVSGYSTGGAFALDHAGAGLLDVPVDRDAGRLNGATGGRHDLGAGPVAGDQRDAMGHLMATL